MQTLYLLDDRKGLYLVSNKAAKTPLLIPFAAMPKFRSPQLSSEVRFEQQGAVKHYAFYVDTLAPSRIRYQLLSGG